MKSSAALAALAALAVTQPARAGDTVAVDPARRFQTLEGWGTSLCWWANVVGGFPDSVRADYVARVFDPVRGLGLNVARYNIGGGENPDIPNTLQTRARVPGFLSPNGAWDWAADANQRRLLFEARKKGVNVLEAFSNSPPYWMTRSGSVAGAPDGGSNLKPEAYDRFADYLAAVVQHYRDAWGVTFRTLDPLNEPNSLWWKKGNNQEGCHFDPRNDQNADQNTLIKKTAAALARRGLPTVVSAADENSIDTTAASVHAWDDEAKAALGQVNTHSYGGSHRDEVRGEAQSLGKRLWMSEYGDGDASGLQLSRQILRDMKALRPTAWVYWQAVDGGGWGLINKDNNAPTDYAYTLNEKYWVMAQYSKFVRPGFRFIGIGDDNSLAAYQAATGTLVVVTTNSGGDTRNVTYDLSRFKKFRGGVTAYRTSPTETLARLPALSVADMRLAAPADAQSVTTYVITKIW